MEKPLFITIEGGEGSGKSSLLRHLEKWFQASNRPYICTREPGGTPLAEELRSVVLRAPAEGYGEVSPLSELLIFLAARLDHVDKVISPALARGEIVLCDRYVDSTVAYQGYGRGLGPDQVRSLSLQIVPLLPDCTLYLDVPIDLAFSRLVRRQQERRDRLEAETRHFHERVREGFLEQARAFPNRIACIDGSKSEQEVAADAIAILSQRLYRRG